MKRGTIIAIVAGLLGLFLMGAIFVGLVAMMFSGDTDIVPRGRGVAVLHLTGVIAGSGDDGGFGGGGIISPERVIEDLHRAADDDSVAAILIRMNSPGGTAAASQEIFTEVERIDKRKPIVVSVGDVGASGGYYIASAARKIVASPASEVGSIGVILEIPNLSGLFKKLGIELQVVSQGKHKDLGNPGRPLTQEEKVILQAHSKIIYDQFIADVARARGMDAGKIRSLATGLTFPGSQAKELGLIDELGNYRDGLLLAGKLGGIAGEPEVIDYDRKELSDILGAFLSSGVRSGIESAIQTSLAESAGISAGSAGSGVGTVTR